MRIFPMHRPWFRPEVTMPAEVAVFGFFVPVLLLVLPVCIVLFVVLDLALASVGLYRYTWHPSLFRVALFIVLFCTVSLCVQA